MKFLATIKAVEIVRQFQHQDGTYGNVYGVTIESGDDLIIAETFKTAESQKRDGIIPGAVGTAVLEFTISRGVNKMGKGYTIQRIGLKRFDLANRNLNNDTAAPASEAAPAAPAAPAPQEPAGEAMPSDGLTF